MEAYFMTEKEILRKQKKFFADPVSGFSETGTAAASYGDA